MKRNFFTLLAVFVLWTSVSAYAIDMSEYRGPWIEEFNPQITKALIAKQIRGCGEYKYRENARHHSEYLVHCTADGKNWVAYLVWPKIKEVEGPFRADPSLK